MFRNVMHMRLAAAAGGVLVLGFFFLMGGSFGNPEIVQVDFSMYPEVFEGCGVEIDGKVVGTLKPTGQATRAGFEVSLGEHVVRVLHPEIDSADIKVDVREGEKVRLMLDMQERYDSETGSTRPVIAAY